MRYDQVISIKDFLNKKLLDSIFAEAARLQALPIEQLPQTLKHKIIACLFYEPSTRTRFSFETAIHRLGGETISTENATEFSSEIKGESLEDTIRVINTYADGIVMRHPIVGSAQTAANISDVPVFNAGDGGGEHPTQVLLDLYTIVRAKSTPDGLKIGLVGDLRNSRIIHSLIYLLSIYKVEIYLIAPSQIRLPDEYKEHMRNQKISFHEFTNWDEVISSMDVLYLTRLQKERFENKKDYDKLFSNYQRDFLLDISTINRMKSDAIILDPLPRNNKIIAEVDADPRAIYFDQVRNGLYLRMALLHQIYS